MCVCVCSLEKAGGEMTNRPFPDRLADASALNAHWMFASSRVIVRYPTTLFANPWESRSLPCSIGTKKKVTWDGNFYNKMIIKQCYLLQKK